MHAHEKDASEQDLPAPPPSPPSLPPAECRYLEQVVHTLERHLQEQLVGVYLFGSAAYGAYEPGISDLDVQAVVRTPSDKDICSAIAESLAHRALPCPARLLEFVLYAQAAIDPASRHPRFELNLNTGAGRPDHLALDPAEEASHWFLLDIAMGRALGRALFGPAPGSVFAPVPRRWALEAMADSLAWHQAEEPVSANGVLNACRAWRYAATDVLGSKREGALWALQQPGCPPVVAQAEEQRHGGPPLDPAAVAALSMIVKEAVQAALRGCPQGEDA